jgi:hypothetical protein
MQNTPRPVGGRGGGLAFAEIIHMPSFACTSQHWACFLQLYMCTACRPTVHVFCSSIMLHFPCLCLHTMHTSCFCVKLHVHAFFLCPAYFTYFRPCLHTIHTSVPACILFILPSLPHTVHSVCLCLHTLQAICFCVHTIHASCLCLHLKHTSRFYLYTVHASSFYLNTFVPQHV